jgi:cell division protein FtsL
MTYLILAIALVGACVLAMFLLQRIYDAQQKLAALHDELRSNERKLESEFERLQREQKSEQQSTQEEQSIEQ